MHPYISQALAAERARDLQNEASAARLARQARRSRRAAPVAPRAGAGTGAGGRLSHPDNDPPVSYAEFFARTHGPLVREPSAAERAHGHAVR